MCASGSTLPLKDVVRFKSITSPCEYVEDYHPGGYHPIHLGDLLKNGQYRIIRKLGEGSYSTVWLARDLRNNIYVAVKIIVSELKEPVSEMRILHHIAQIARAEDDQYVTRLLDEFNHHGPNGDHTCLVFEPMGPSVNVMVEELPQFKPRMWGMNVRYPVWMATNILKQSLQALAFLHDKGIAHGDFQPGNMLFCLNEISSEPEDVLRQQTDVEARSISPPVQRLDGKPDQWAPRYLCIAQPLVRYTDYSASLRIKLSDMGAGKNSAMLQVHPLPRITYVLIDPSPAYFLSNPPTKLVTPLGLRPPELVLTGQVGKSLDVWSFGCLVFELITGQPLFCVPPTEFEDDNHLLELSARIGPLPDELFKQWKSSSLYYTRERQLYNCHLGGVPEGGEPLMLEQTSMEEAFDQADTGLGEEESRSVKALIRRILQYDPMKRPSAKEILDHWLCF